MSILTIVALVVGGIALAALAAAVGCVLAAARTEVAEAEGERIAEHLSRYDYPSGTFRF